MKRYFSDIFSIGKNTIAAWLEADPFRQSAVVAYYAIFSIPALLVIVISLAGIALGRDAIQGEISAQIAGAVGHDAAKQVEEIIAESSGEKTSLIATLVGVVTLILGSTGVFLQLQTSLNQIWNVKVTSEKKWLKSIKDRLFSFGLVLSIGFLMLVSLLITTFLEAFSNWLERYLPDFMLYIFHLTDFVVSFGFISILFALIFKILPDAKVQWRDVRIGAIVTALLFILGKYLLGIYFAKVNPGSTYGAAGSIILLMLWVSYSCMILFLGAEFTKQYALYYGRSIEPTRDAQLIQIAEKEKRK